MARGQMQREQGVAVGREWAGRRSTISSDELQSQVFRVSRTHRVEQARHSRGVLPGLGEGEALGGRAWHKHFFHGALGAVTRLRWVPGVWEVGRQGSGCRTFVLEVWQHEGRGNQATRLLS